MTKKRRKPVVSKVYGLPIRPGDNPDAVEAMRAELDGKISADGKDIEYEAKSLGDARRKSQRAGQLIAARLLGL